MTIGEKIAQYRARKKITQEAFAERLGVSFQAVSEWERGACMPDLRHIPGIADTMGISADALLRDDAPVFEITEKLYDETRMYTYLKTTAAAREFSGLLAALPYAREKHAGQKRKSRECDIPYIVHPLTMACHALAMGIRDDDILAVILLHDVAEDCGVSADELPANDAVKKAVRLLSHNSYAEGEDALYFANIAKDPNASVVKVIDRINNVSGMAHGFTRKKQEKYIVETEKYILPILENLPEEFAPQKWLMKYQLITAIETFKRMLSA